MKDNFALKRAFSLLLFLLVMATVPVNASRISGVIEIGCDSEEVFELTEKLAENFMDKYPRIQIFIQKISPEEAIDKLKRGLLDIVFTLDYINFRNTVPQVLAKEGIVFIVNEQNTKDNLTLEELSAIFNGKVKSWNDLGLNAVLSRRLEIVCLEEASNTQRLFAELFPFNTNYKPSTILNSDQEVIKYVSENRYALGYISLNSVIDIDGEVKMVSIDEVFPSLDNAFKNHYKYCNTYYLITETTPYGVIERFIDFITDVDNSVLKNYGLISYKEVFD